MPTKNSKNREYIQPTESEKVSQKCNIKGGFWNTKLQVLKITSSLQEKLYKKKTTNWNNPDKPSQWFSRRSQILILGSDIIFWPFIVQRTESKMILKY